MKHRMRKGEIGSSELNLESRSSRIPLRSYLQACEQFLRSAIEKQFTYG